MAAMTTVLTEFASNGNSRTSTLVGHTAAEPELVIEKRKVATNTSRMAEQSYKIVKATKDAEGNILTSKVTVETIVRYPIDGLSTDVDAAVATNADIAVGDEFANSVSTQQWLNA
jgi:hypothetical protein